MQYTCRISVDKNKNLLTIKNDDGKVNVIQALKDIKAYQALPIYSVGDILEDRKTNDKCIILNIDFIHDINGFTGFAYWMQLCDPKYSYSMQMYEHWIEKTYIVTRNTIYDRCVQSPTIIIKPHGFDFPSVTFGELLEYMQEDLEFYQTNRPDEVEDLLKSKIRISIRDDNDFECSCTADQYAGHIKDQGTFITGRIDNVDFEN